MYDLGLRRLVEFYGLDRHTFAMQQKMALLFERPSINNAPR